MRLHKLPSLPLAALAMLTALASVQITQGAETDPSFTNPANLGPTVNSLENEYEPSISADGLELYFHSYRTGGVGQADIYVSTRKSKADPWGAAVNLGATVNSPAGDKGSCISADGLSFYFNSDRPGGSGGQDLWVTMRKSKTAPWGEPVNLGPMVNTPAHEQSPSISAEGLTLYFSAWPADNSSEDWDKSDLWMTTRKSTVDPWGKPVNLGPTVNSSAYDASPSLSEDGLSLYFDSERSGTCAIWVTTRESISGAWGTPVQLGPAVNTDWEANPEISKDGTTLYFVSTRRGGVGKTDLWQATLAKGSASTPESKEQSEKPRFAARTFKSSLAFYVYSQETSRSDEEYLGQTPSTNSLGIPACRIWWVRPVPPVKDWEALIRELTQNKVPGLMLYPATDADLRHFESLTGVEYLALPYAQMTDAGLEHLKVLTGIRSLNLSGTRITGRGLEKLKGLTELQDLELKDTPVVDKDLEHLSGLTGLQQLGLNRTAITDAGLAHLKNLTELRGLNLWGTVVSDAGLAHLKRLPKLELLDLGGCLITDAGLAQFRSFPELRSLDLAGC